MRAIRTLGSLAFVLGLFVTIFVGIPWHVLFAADPPVPLWLQIAIFCLLGGILVVLLTLAAEQAVNRKSQTDEPDETPDASVILSNALEVPGRKITEIVGVVQGHTVYAIWVGKDLSAIMRLILGGELTEYSQMMGKARTVATNRMVAQASELGADAIINVRYMTTSVIGSAAELLVYGTAVKLSE